MADSVEVRPCREVLKTKALLLIRAIKQLLLLIWIQQLFLFTELPKLSLPYTNSCLSLESLSLGARKDPALIEEKSSCDSSIVDSVLKFDYNSHF